MSEISEVEFTERGCQCHLGHPPCSYCTSFVECPECEDVFNDDEGQCPSCGAEVER